MTNWHNKTADEALKECSSTAFGLNEQEALTRLTEIGKNELKEAEGKSNLRILVEQFKNPLILILAIGALVSYLTGHIVDGTAISVIIIINALIAFWQELKAKRGMEALKEMASPKATVIRDGQSKVIDARELVPGDILEINTGDILPADIRIIEANNLNIDEAPLTGESEPVNKHVDALPEGNISLGDQNNMAFMTTLVSSGNGLGLVVRTGMQTEVGHIAEMMNNTEVTKTPMQVRMDAIAHTLMIAALAVVAVVAGIGLFYGMPWLEILNTSISLSVAAIPEGLPTIVSIVLTLGSTKLAKNNALAKELAAIETLGSTTVICSDKTGTLTQNQMQVMNTYDASGRYWSVGGKGFDIAGEFTPIKHQSSVTESPEMRLGLTIATLCNDAEHLLENGSYHVRGNPTEGALIVAAAKAGLNRSELLDDEGYSVIKKFPFDSTRKMASVIVKSNTGQHFLAVKGAPDVMLRQSAAFMVNGKDLNICQNACNNNLALAPALDEHIIEDYQNAINYFADKALRTLTVGYKPLSEADLELTQEELESNITILAMFGIMDPPRPEVKAAIDTCYKAGIRTVMITGDHALTAAAVAREIGIIRKAEDKVVTGAELDEMDDHELKKICSEVAVFARVSPEHKLRIVKAQQANNEVPAMTGDGVNDAPALRRADIGVAMGIEGTSVAKDSADLILLDDNFSTIVKAVRKGRQIFDNLRKFIRQALTANVGEVSVILIAFLVMGPEMVLPLTPLMLLWINLVSDGLPALALGVEPAEKDLMQRKPRKRDQGIFSDGLGLKILIRGLALGGVSFAAFSMVLSAGYSEAYAQSTTFAMLVFAQLWHLFDARGFASLFRKNPLSNKWLLGAVAGSAGLSLAVIYSNIGQAIFNTQALSLTHLGSIIILASIPTLLLSTVREVTKLKFI
ncbi:calcium-translocating P-type ATPase, SERCA-type [Agarivorans albus]